MEWVLIIYIYASAMARWDSAALLSVPGFTSQALCKDAGEITKSLVSSSGKNIRYVCLEKK